MVETTPHDEILEVLRKVTLFTEIRDIAGAVESMAVMMKRHSFENGHVLIRQGTEGDEFFVLLKGSVAVSKRTTEGDEYKVVVMNHHHHPAFGEGGLMEGEVRSATIVCESPVECLVLSRRDFDLFCREKPAYALPVFKKIAQSLMSRLNQTSNDLMLLHKALMDEIRNS